MVRAAGDGAGAANGLRWSGTDRASGVSAVVALRSAGWGTDVDLDVRDAPQHAVCTLVAVGRDGDVQTVATWTAGKDGPLHARGAAALPPDAIGHFEVRTAGGKMLVSVWPQKP